jgi:outer membrane beta-barrel protein
MRLLPLMLVLPSVVATLAALPAAADDAQKDEAPPPASDVAGATGADDNAAFQRIEEREPRPGTPLIANKLYPMRGRFELGLFFDKSYADKYVDHIGGHASATYHVLDWLAFEAFGGYLVGDETGIVDNVRRDDSGGGKSANNTPVCFGGGSGPCEPQLPGLYQTTWFAGAEAQWAPIYGKLSAVSEYDVNFQFYTKLGGGAQGIRRFLSAGDYGDVGVRPSGHYGVGLRVIPWKYTTLRAELTNYVGLNPNVEEHAESDEASCPDGFVLPDGNRDVCHPDIFQSSFFQIGLSFVL